MTSMTRTRPSTRPKAKVKAKTRAPRRREREAPEGFKIGFFVTEIATEKVHYTTTLIAMEAAARGHAVYYLDAEDFQYSPDDHLVVRGRRAVAAETPEAFLEHVKSDDAEVEHVTSEDLDVLMLRVDLGQLAESRPWVQSTGFVFGQMAARRGVIVLSDPDSLARSLNKLYFQYFPIEVRPRTLITRDAAAIKEFIQEQQGHVILKPLQGSGGQSVFLVREGEPQNVNQMIEAVRRDGYVICQEYLPAAAEGDLRFFLMNGEPLVVDGKYCAIRRVGEGGDVRSNMHVGGRAEKPEIPARALEIAAIVGPKLAQDGMFLVGLDIAGDKLMEINVMCPGGMNSAEKLWETRFSPAVVDAIEAKVAVAKRYPGTFENARLASL